jgi:hypothetical protein
MQGPQANVYSEEDRCCDIPTRAAVVTRRFSAAVLLCCGISGPAAGNGYAQAAPARPTVVLHAARMLDVAAGKVVTPGEVLVQGERIAEAGPRVSRNNPQLPG